MTDTSPTPTGWRRHLDVAATILVILTCGALLWRTFGSSGRAAPRPEPPLPSAPVSIEGAATKGTPEAPVVMIVFSEFECPFCATFAKDTWPSLLENYVEPGRLLVAYRHFPLEQIHPNAMAAGKAAECAGRANQFWQMHDVLFRQPRPLDPDHFSDLAATLGLDVTSFDTCMQGDADSRVRADMAEGRTLGVSGTPTFFFGRRSTDGAVVVVSRLTGARSLSEFRAQIDGALTIPQ
jgi:protein-disulfide isomerase